MFLYFQSDENPVVVASVKALEKIFSHLATNGLLPVKGPPLETEAEKKIREWSRERYQEFQDRLFALLATDQVSLQELALVSLMSLLQTEGKFPFQKVPEGKNYFFSLELLEVFSLYNE